MIKVTILALAVPVALAFAGDSGAEGAFDRGLALGTQLNTLEVPCDKYCVWCMVGHKVVGEGTGVKHYRGHVESCQATGDCSDHYCWPQEEQEDRQLLDRIVEQLEGAGIEELRGALKASPDRLLLSVERRSLQVTTCNGRISANIPLSETEFIALSD